MVPNVPDGLTNTLMATLARDPRVDVNNYPIQVKIDDKTLILEGVQQDIAAKRAAVLVARAVAGTLSIVDRLRVIPAQAQEDGMLRDEIVRTLSEEPVFTDYGLRMHRHEGYELLRQARPGGGAIDITVRNGIVQLLGEVGSLTHRRIAEVLAWWTAGCQDVDNRLRVVPPEEENDGELSDAIRIVLEKDPLVHAGQLSVHSRDGVVTLNGYVASQEERRLVVLDTWYVPGVHEVIDEIDARA